MVSGKSLSVVAAALNSSAIHLLRAVQVVDREAGVPPARLSALSVLVFGGARTLTSLARAEGVTPATMSRVVDGLCESGLATRSPHPDNRRMVVVTATARGEELMQEARARRVDLIAGALRRLDPADRAAVTAARDALERLAAKVAAAAATDPSRRGG